MRFFRGLGGNEIALGQFLGSGGEGAVYSLPSRSGIERTSFSVNQQSGPSVLSRQCLETDSRHQQDATLRRHSVYCTSEYEIPSMLPEKVGPKSWMVIRLVVTGSAHAGSG